VVNWRLNADAEICSIDVQTGQVSVMSRPDIDHSQFGGHGWYNAANNFYYGLEDQKTRDWNIVDKNLENGTAKIIYRSGDFYTFSLSPDGQWFALICPSFEDAKIIVVSSDGKESKILCRFKEGTELGRVPCHAWSADGKYIYFNIRESQPDPDATTPEPLSSGTFELCRIPAKGGEIEKLGLKINGLFLNMSMHPDGSRIAFSMEDQFLSEIWVMENIFPE
jgi:Tol biopolymer transport system component